MSGCGPSSPFTTPRSVRCWAGSGCAYPDHDAAVHDALDLAEAMTYEAALAGLELGGGKSVIKADPAHP